MAQIAPDYLKEKKMNKRHRYYGGTNPLLVVLTVIQIGFFIVLLYYSHLQDEQREAYLKMIYQQERDRKLAQKEAEYLAELDPQEEEENDSFYQKLADGLDVNILIVGDSIAAGDGISDKERSWSSLLKNEISETYGGLVTLTNVSMGGNSSYAGFVRTMTLNDNIDYDLIVLCYGQNDLEEDFAIYYEAMIHAAKNRYPKASLLAILESSQKEYTLKMQTIQKIASHYRIPIVDTIAPFQADYDSLTIDSIHPNDNGHAIYCSMTMDVINSLVSKRYGFDPSDVTLIENRVIEFDDFRWFGADQFTRDNNTFTLNTTVDGTILGIDYDFVSGENSCKVIIDGEEYAAPEVKFDYDFSQRHIMVVNNWIDGDVISVQKEIQVVFADDEKGQTQADGFRGLAISG